jgi:cysteinyl-tRNA synthetase, unknown class
MPQPMRMLKFLLFLLVVGAGLYGLALVESPRGTLPPRIGPAISDAKSWGYQLQEALPDRVAASLDMLVVDYANGSPLGNALSVEDVQRFRQRPDGKQRIILAYLSVGEAESYRYYWQNHWRLLPPHWLSKENKDWKRNFHVRFWEPGWQSLIVQPRTTILDLLLDRGMTARKPYLDRILEAGFDGVYLDRVDAFYEWAKQRPTAEADMIAFVAAISTHAKARKPGFLVVPQNAEELLNLAAYRKHIDAVAKEDLLFGVGGPEAENQARDAARSIQLLNKARADKLPVFVVEYLADPEKRKRAQQRMTEQGFILHFASRALDRPPELLEPSAVIPATSTPTPAIPPIGPAAIGEPPKPAVPVPAPYR